MGPTLYTLEHPWVPPCIPTHLILHTESDKNDSGKTEKFQKIVTRIRYSEIPAEVAMLSNTNKMEPSPITSHSLREQHR